MNPADTVGGAVTALFVPGDRADRFSKAAAAGPDIVIIDLEDAVAPDAKGAALVATIEAVGNGFQAVVRMNSASTEYFQSELEALVQLTATPGSGLLGVMIPKAEDVETVELVRGRIPAELAVVPLIESAAGVVATARIVACQGVTRLAFGAIDFVADIDASGEDEFLAYARSLIVVHSRAFRISPPLDTPIAEFSDEAVVASAAKRARGYGFGGKLCIHPRQVAIITAAFQPDDRQITWARAVISVGAGVGTVDGAMVDRPVVLQARSILRRAGLGADINQD